MRKVWGIAAVVCATAVGAAPATGWSARSGGAPDLVRESTGPDVARASQGEERPPDRPRPHPVERQASARAQLEQADVLRRAVRTTPEAQRTAARLRAADAYRAVREHYPGDAAACAEAAFRRAELLRQAEELETARAEYALARERGAGTPWRVRAALEQGHLERRARRSPEALAAYDAVVADASSSPGQRDEASLWTARVLADLGRAADAVRIWTRLGDGADDPLDRIRAHDDWARDLVARGDLEGAAGVLERCREKLFDAAQEESRLGERVRNALTSMRALEDLARAIARRREAPPPAAQTADERH
jgi:tetratricopeptide (TPR) repeat protein